MLEYNEGATQKIKLDSLEFKKICLKVFGSSENVSCIEPLSNGAVNTTYKISRNGELFALRFYIRDPLLCEIEKEILQLVDSQVSIPELIYSEDVGSPHPFAVFRYIEGKHLFEITDPSLASEISFELGKTLASIHKIKFKNAGLFGPRLELNPIFEEGSTPYYQYIKDHLKMNSLAWERIGDGRVEKVISFIDKYRDYFPVIKDGGVLVHSDFKPVNILWSKSVGMTILDWEFAHSGNGLMDFAILLRHYREFPLDIHSLKKGYIQGGCTLQNDWIKRARITDFVNIIQLLDSPIDRPKLYEALCESMMITMNHWDQLEEIICA